MQTTKLMTALFMTGALCTACDNKKDTATPAEKAPEVKIGAAKQLPYDPGMVSLAHNSNCFSCHTIDKNVVGPAWKDVAEKYRGDATAEEKLIAKVSKGSSGVWGNVPMPASSPAVKDDDIRMLVKFILSLK